MSRCGGKGGIQAGSLGLEPRRAQTCRPAGRGGLAGGGSSMQADMRCTSDADQGAWWAAGGRAWKGGQMRARGASKAAVLVAMFTGLGSMKPLFNFSLLDGISVSQRWRRAEAASGVGLCLKALGAPEPLGGLLQGAEVGVSTWEDPPGAGGQHYAVPLHTRRGGLRPCSLGPCGGR